MEDQAQVSEFYSMDGSRRISPSVFYPIFSASSPVTDFEWSRSSFNAVKFTPEGGDELLDDLSPETVAGFSFAALAVTKNFLRIEVQDSGVAGDVQAFTAMLYTVVLDRGCGYGSARIWRPFMEAD
eukprot:gene33324-43084_t